MQSEHCFHYTSQLESPWSDVKPVVLGDGEAKGIYVLVSKHGSPRQVFSLARSDRDECWFQQEGIFWKGLCFIGLAERVYVVDSTGTIVNKLCLTEYFCGFASGDDWLLVATGGRILRLDQHGNLLWQSAPLAIDGVSIGSVRDGSVFGQGEWDPPDGWLPFKLDLVNGTRQSI